VPESSWHAAIEKMLPPKLVEVNLKAFALGREKKQ
jgi:Pyruvate/2-oxoacid:ferredoxin oxidoreductase gamma subunit